MCMPVFFFCRTTKNLKLTCISTITRRSTTIVPEGYHQTNLNFRTSDPSFHENSGLSTFTSHKELPNTYVSIKEINIHGYYIADDV